MAGDLAARNAVLDGEALAGLAERDQLVDGLQRFFHRRRDDGALAHGGTIRLHNHWATCVAHVVAGSVRVIEDLGARVRDAVALHELLGPRLARLELGGCLRRPEGRDAGALDRVDEAPRQRVVRRHECEVDPEVARRLHDGLHVCLDVAS